MTNPVNRLKRDMPDVAEALDAQNWTVGLTRNNHLKCTSPDGEVVITSGTPSDRRSDKNFIAQLQRHGLSLEPLPRGRERGVPMLREANAEAIEYWSGGKTAIYLGATAKEIREWAATGVLQPAVDPPKRRGRPGLTFFSSTVMGFKDSETHQLLRSTRRQPKVEPVEIESLRIVVARRSMEELTPSELADALVEAMKPAIDQAVKNAVSELLRKALT
jgi:hypothetical protein